MQLRALLISFFGLCLAGASVFLADQLMNSAPQQSADVQQKRPEFVRVLVAKSDIQFGQVIERDLLDAKPWPSENVPDDAFISTRALLGPEDASPRRAKQLIRTGDLILDGRISGFGETVTLVQNLGANTRAMAIEVDAATAVGGFVTPGDRVDIVLTEGRGSDLRAATILQDVRVLGVDQNAEQDKKANRVARTITVEVTPREGQILALGQRAGVLSLTLRTATDVADAELEQISLDDVLRSADAIPIVDPVAVVAPVPRQTVRVRRGIEETEVELK